MRGVDIKEPEYDGTAADEFELLDFLNFSLRLQAATTNTIATIRETFFIRSPNAGQIRKANAFYANRAQVSN